MSDEAVGSNADGEAGTCGAQYGSNPDLCYQPRGHRGTHSNRFGTTWSAPAPVASVEPDGEACDCYPGGFTADTYEGPKEDCPVHGRRAPAPVAERTGADEVEALALALYYKDKAPGERGWKEWSEHTEAVHEIWRGYAQRFLASGWLARRVAAAKREGAQEALSLAALEVREAKSIPITARAAVAAVLAGRARAASLPTTGGESDDPYPCVTCKTPADDCSTDDDNCCSGCRHLPTPPTTGEADTREAR